VANFNGSNGPNDEDEPDEDEDEDETEVESAQSDSARKQALRDEYKRYDEWLSRQWDTNRKG
jgi:hypothetical protein